MAVRRVFVLAVLLAGCAPPRVAPGAEAVAAATLALPSELPPGSALDVARATLRREGWPFGAATATTLTTGWRETAAGPIRLFMTASEVDGGASTVLRLWGETRAADGAAVPVTRPEPGGRAGRAAGTWAVVAEAARRVGAEARYARP